MTRIFTDDDLREPEGGADFINEDWYEDNSSVLEHDHDSIELRDALCMSVDIPDEPAPRRDIDLLDYLKAAFRKHTGEEWWRHHQRRGTCVGQGVTNTCNVVAAVNHFVAGTDWHGVYAVAPTYAGGRVEIGKSPGSWDGSRVIWSCLFVSRYGLVTHQEMGLTPGALWDDEKIAVNWARSRQGVPSEFENLSKQRPIDAYYNISTTREMEWLIDMGHPIVQGSNRIPSGSTDSTGVARSVKNSGGHCTGCWAKRYTDNDVQFAYDNSWGDSWGVQGRVWLSSREWQRIIARGDTYALIGQTGTDSVADDVTTL